MVGKQCPFLVTIQLIREIEHEADGYKALLSVYNNNILSVIPRVVSMEDRIYANLTPYLWKVERLLDPKWRVVTLGSKGK